MCLDYYYEGTRTRDTHRQAPFSLEILYVIRTHTYCTRPTLLHHKAPAAATNVDGYTFPSAPSLRGSYGSDEEHNSRHEAKRILGRRLP